MEKVKNFLLVGFLIVTFFLSGCADKNNAKQIIGNISQNIWDYVSPSAELSPLMDKEKQMTLSEDYLQHFFSPWTGQKRLYDDAAIKDKELSTLQQFEEAPGFGENRQRYSVQWSENIKDNMNMATFGQYNHKAIVTEASNLRVLPTQDPSYSSITKAGQYYPFDELQESYVSVGTPALILQSTKDGAWDLIYLNNGFGWISHQHIAYVSDDFIKQYQSLPFGVITADHTPITIQGKFAFSGRLGSIYPIPQNTESALYIPVRDTNQQAIILLANTDKNKIQPFPVSLTAKKMATLIQPLVGNPYGWGGMYAYRDCSATTMDLFASFGVWLPRNSSNQMKIGNIIPLDHLKRKQKEEIIARQGIPFLTLIGMPGHVMLYMGTYHGKIYVLQDIWGLRTGLLREGRAVIGQTVITPLDFDRRFLNVPTRLIDKVNGMRNL